MRITSRRFVRQLKRNIRQAVEDEDYEGAGEMKKEVAAMKSKVCCESVRSTSVAHLASFNPSHYYRYHHMPAFGAMLNLSTHLRLCRIIVWNGETLTC